jgi:hypothetical protein
MGSARLVSTLLLGATATTLVSAQGPRPVGAAAPPSAVQAFTVRVDAPARVGLPIWVHSDLTGFLTARYPFNSNLRYLACTRLELKRDGHVLSPRPLGSLTLGGPECGSAAPRSSPQNRLPLHVIFAIDTPGRYSVRWTVTNGFPASGTTVAQSAWLDFDISAAKASEREAWLSKLLAAPPSDSGAYVGDYLPSLLADPSDPRVARAIVDGTYSLDSLVASFAVNSLGTLPADLTVPSTLEALRRRGPSRELADFVSGGASWFEDRRDEIVEAATSSLLATNPARAAGALQLLVFAQVVDWPPGSTTLHDANEAVKAAAPALIARGGDVAHTLALRLGQIHDATARDLLWQIVEQLPREREQALIAITWHRDVRDLPKLADLLFQPGDPDPSGRDLSSLPYHFRDAYGDAGLSVLERAVTESPYVWVRTDSARELVMAGRSAGFKFLLDAIESNRSYRSEMEGWLRRMFPAHAKDDADTCARFLSESVSHPPPSVPRSSDAPIDAAVAQLKSADATSRTAAARTLLDLGHQSAETSRNLGAIVVNDILYLHIGSGPSDLTAESWRDAALVLARLQNPIGTSRLTLYMERDGATAALIELGTPVVPAVGDILRLGRPVRRRLSAEVLGAIGGTLARDTLRAALKTEKDAEVKRAIEHALDHLGQRPPQAQFR